MAFLAGKSVVLGVTGGISAYKAAELCRLLRKADARVRVVMTRAATEFITPLTLQTLSGAKVATNLFDLEEESEIGHIRLADEADLVIVAPATADAIARFAAGMADDLLAAVVLATRAPVLLAPAMNVNMWEHPLTRDNLRRLIGTGRVHTVGPDSGALACGWIGAGRLVEPTEIVAAANEIVSKRLVPAARGSEAGALFGRKIVVSAGPTHEPVDDVRFLGNRSSGKMGFALAASAARLGAEVVLVAGPVGLETPAGISRRIDVETALEMQAAMVAASADADVIVMAAAVADFRPAERIRGKLDRHAHGTAPVDLVPNPDILSDLGAKRTGRSPLLVGFAAEVGADDLVARARTKLARKRCDVIVANDVGKEGLGFGSDDNAVVIVTTSAATPLGPAPKTSLADSIWNNLLPALPAARRARSL